MRQGEKTIQFDVLIKGRPGDREPSLANIEYFKPASDDIEKCKRWFEKNAIAVYATEFGLSGETTKEHFESIFKIRLTPMRSDSIGPPFKMSSDPHLPEEIAELIEQITLSVPPEFF
jgi:hypothetical protein